MFGRQPILGEVTRSSVWLRKRHFVERYSYQRFLNATLRPENGGTSLSGDFILHPFHRIGLIGSSCVLSICLVGAFITLSSHLLRSGTSWVDWHTARIQLSVIPLIAFLIFGLLRFDSYLARKDKQFIKDFLIRTLNANERTQNT